MTHFCIQSLSIYYGGKIFKLKNITWNKTYAISGLLLFLIIIISAIFYIPIHFIPSLIESNIYLLMGFVELIIMLTFIHVIINKYYKTSILKSLCVYFVGYIIIVVLIVTIVSLIRLFISPFRVVGSSMSPAFPNGKFLIANKIGYNLKRTDAVIIKYPENEKALMFTRIIGLPGEKIQIKKDGVYVNNEKLNENYIKEKMVAGEYLNKVWNLKNDEYFIMGDNRNHSADSRKFGPIKKEAIIGEYLISIK